MDVIILLLQRLIINEFFFSNVRNYWKLSAALFPFFKDKLITRRPYTIYLDPYISSSFSMQQRIKILTQHYSFLANTYSCIQLRQLWLQGIKCFSEIHDNVEFSIILKRSIKAENEGPLSLYFKANDDLISIMSFTFSQGFLFNCRSENIIYISRLQRELTPQKNNDLFIKHFKNIHPSVILLKAIEAFALTLNINELVGITAKNQLSYNNKEKKDNFTHSYNDFWNDRGGVCLNDNYFFSLPINDKPLLGIKQKHRNKTVRRRNQLNDIYNICFNTFNKFNKHKGHQIPSMQVLTQCVNYD